MVPEQGQQMLATRARTTEPRDVSSQGQQELLLGHSSITMEGVGSYSSAQSSAQNSTKTHRKSNTEQRKYMESTTKPPELSF